MHLWLVVFEPVCLINDQHLPGYWLKDGRVNTNELIGGQQHMELHRNIFLLCVCVGGGGEGNDTRSKHLYLEPV